MKNDLARREEALERVRSNGLALWIDPIHMTSSFSIPSGRYRLAVQRRILQEVDIRRAAALHLNERILP